MTKLASYLDRADIRQADFAARVGASQGAISRLSQGKYAPSMKLAVAIERETNGEVPVSSWAEVALPLIGKVA